MTQPPRDKQMSIEAVVDQLRDGMTIGIGGWASRRKPMALVRAIANSDLKDLTVVSYGGPDVGLLCAAGKVKKVVFGFVSLDSIPLESNFRRARQNGEIEAVELDEGMLNAGLNAAGQRLPFMPIRAGLGSDFIGAGWDMETITSPYGDRETLLAMPAIELDVALVHMNRADIHGNAQFLGPDPYFDHLYCLAAKRSFVSCEQIVPTAELTRDATFHSLRINRMMVSGVVETPNGAHFTSCEPDYARDEAFQRAYAAAGRSEETWAAFADRFLASDEAAYQEAVKSFAVEEKELVP